MTPKDAATWASILVAAATGVAGVVRSNAQAEHTALEVSRLESTTAAQVLELKSAIAQVSQEGRLTRDMAIETKSQVAQILAAITRVENKLDARSVSARQ
jgi:hypothetical protein